MTGAKTLMLHSHHVSVTGRMEGKGTPSEHRDITLVDRASAATKQCWRALPGQHKRRCCPSALLSLFTIAQMR